MTDPATPDTTTADLDDIVAAAATAAGPMATAGPSERAGWLRAAARALEAQRSVLVPLAQEESRLPEARLSGELSRTTGQLELLATEVETGAVWDAVIDHADPDWKPVPRPDLRRVAVPLGPVAVYAASNFPFAFSVAGGDTASALAAGCPVVVKAHPGHPRLSVAVAEVVAGALAEAGAPGALGLVHGFDAGIALIQHPAVRAGAFTGSIGAGRALFDLAAARPEPIPFYGELGSVNPVVVTPAAAAARAAEIGTGYAGSLSLGVGQFCTNPGILFAPSGAGVIEAAAAALAQVPAAPMLNDRIAQGYAQGLQSLREVEGVRVVVDGSSGDAPTPSLLAVDIDRFAEVDRLREECFGPVSIVVEYEDTDDVVAEVGSFDGQLTATVHGEDGDGVAAALVDTLAQRAGRVVWNDWPTGVAVTYAMQHGGPYPAATAATTSVGTAAVQRFGRPVAYQDLPQSLLPPPRRDDNPWNLPRRVDGTWQRP
ncbi:aldehyde dehydrogenase (NADP(+)) [Pseudactinotalea sp.]|uniref:aldehyde dehydrogenase (NADP(+)) n=1 Tax=Pseudactinotalea sp. TaxID=1926260 RepID=UPI003B3ACA6D